MLKNHNVSIIKKLKNNHDKFMNDRIVRMKKRTQIKDHVKFTNYVLIFTHTEYSL